MRLFELFEQQYPLGSNFYLAAKSRMLDEDFYRYHQLNGIEGISANPRNLQQFGPNTSRDILFVMPSNDTMALNNLTEVKYFDADFLLDDDMRMVRRVMNASAVVHRICTTFDIPQLYDDPKGINGVDDLHQWLITSTQAGGHREYYMNDYMKALNADNAKDVIRDAVVKEIGAYASEAEWVVNSHALILPQSTRIVFMTQDTESDKAVIERLKDMPFKLKVIGAKVTADRLTGATFRASQKKLAA